MTNRIDEIKARIAAIPAGSRRYDHEVDTEFLLTEVERLRGEHEKALSVVKVMALAIASQGEAGNIIGYVKFAEEMEAKIEAIGKGGGGDKCCAGCPDCKGIVWNGVGD